eukprot:18636-Heterococcus_DN1.PRE.3
MERERENLLRLILLNNTINHCFPLPTALRGAPLHIDHSSSPRRWQRGKVLSSSCSRRDSVPIVVRVTTGSTVIASTCAPCRLVIIAHRVRLDPQLRAQRWEGVHRGAWQLLQRWHIAVGALDSAACLSPAS